MAMWTFVVSGGPWAAGHAAVCHDGRVYSFGGSSLHCQGDPWEKMASYQLETSTMRWTPLAYKGAPDDIPDSRYGHTAVLYNNKIYIWGGCNFDVSDENLYVLDLTTLRWTSPMCSGTTPEAKVGHTACICGNQMYVFGGSRVPSHLQAQEMLHRLDLVTLTWREVEAEGEAPQGRFFHSAVEHSGRMYVFGGEGRDRRCYSSLTYLDVKASKWFSVQPSGQSPEPRKGHSAWVHRDQMYIFGGVDETLKHFNTLHRYSFANNTWQEVIVGGELPRPRGMQACLLVGDKVYMFGGRGPWQSQVNPTYGQYILDYNEAHIMDYSPTLETLSKLSVIRHRVDYTPLPKSIITDVENNLLPNDVN